MSFADEYNRLVMKYARLAESAIHPDWHPTGISPRVGHVLRLIADEEHKYPVSGEMATTALIFGPGIGDEHFEQLGRELHNEGHPYAGAFEWGNVPGAVGFDKRVLEAIKPEWDHRFENPTPSEINYRTNHPEVPLEARRYSNLMGLAGWMSHSANHADRIARQLRLDHEDLTPEERVGVWDRIRESLSRISTHAEDAANHIEGWDKEYFHRAATDTNKLKSADRPRINSHYPTKYPS